MKAIFPILICSLITGLLGFYYGQIKKTTGTTDSSVAAPQNQSAAGQTTTPTAVATVPAPAPPPQPAPITPEPELASTEPAPADPVPSDPVAEEETSAGVDESEFAARAAKPTQTLTNSEGVSINAKILEVTATDVKLRRTDGLETSIPLSMLSQKDIAFCEYLREEGLLIKEEEPAAPADTDGFDWDAYFNS